MTIHGIAGEVISEAYELEYGKDRLEMHVGAVQKGERAVIIDDLVATGGTLTAAIKLLGKLQLFFGFWSRYTTFLSFWAHRHCILLSYLFRMYGSWSGWMWLCYRIAWG